MARPDLGHVARATACSYASISLIDAQKETYPIPLIVRWPGTVAPGTTSGALVSSMDLAPTIVEMSGCAPFAKTQARRAGGRGL